MKKIVPNLWFAGNASEAVDFYVSVFSANIKSNSEEKGTKILSTSYYPNSEKEGLADFQKELAGKVLTIDFELRGQAFTAINAGNEFKFNEAISFAVFCKDQEEIDYFWSKLSAHPGSEQCGWCKDKFGLSWQIVPANMEELMQVPNAFEIMMQQKKIVIADYKSM